MITTWYGTISSTAILPPPAAGSVRHPRQTDGNTLGSVRDADVEVSQDFFALQLSHADGWS